MKKASLFLIFLFCISPLFSQNRVTIIFNDGTQIKGYGRIKANGSILYRKDKDAKKEIYSYKTKRQVRKLIVNDYTSDKEYHYKIIAGSPKTGKVELLEVIKSGRVNLYKETFSNVANQLNGGFGTSYTFTSTKVTYYLSTDTDGKNIAFSLRRGNTYSKRFKNITNKYFRDCEDLVDKIKTRSYFGRYEIESIVDYYNETCE